jgi:hypothetical protein
MNLETTITIFATGTSEGVKKEWDERGRGRKARPASTTTRTTKEKAAVDEFLKEIEKQGYDKSKTTIVYKAPVDSNFGVQPIAVSHNNTGIIEFHPDVWLEHAQNMPIGGVVAHELEHLKFKAFADDHNMNQENLMGLAKDDGVTGYSEECWRQVYSHEAGIALGVHETLAEMARLQSDTGKLPGTAQWKDLYKRVNDYYAQHH